jgi:hypothetical protein
MATHHLTRTKSALLAADRRKLEKAQALIAEVMLQITAADQPGTEACRQWTRLADALQHVRSALGPGLV